MDKNLPRGLRNCNPGNIEKSKGKPWMGEIQPSQDKRFAQFRSMPYGYRALIKLLQNYRKLHNCQTLADFINRWAPPSENNTSAYVKAVATEMQVPTILVIDIEDKATMVAQAAAISHHENGVKANRAEVLAGWDLLHA